MEEINDWNNAESAKAYLAAIVESSDDAIISKTLQGIITSWNKGAERIFGYTSSEAVGKPINMLIPPDRQQEEEEILDRLKRGLRVEHYETVRMRKGGTLLNISLTVSPIKDLSGRIVGASKIARDITEQKRSEAEREQLLSREMSARAQAEEAGRLKDEFLAVVSHELRTPLNGILGWAHILRTGGLDADSTLHALETIERNGRFQAQLIEDILDVSRIVTGTLRLNIQNMDLPRIVEAAIESMRPAAAAKEISIENNFDCRPGLMPGDPQRIQQVVWNLLSNAVKFTPPGGRVRILLERSDSQVTIAVSDTGAGIREEFLPYVFDRFRQGDSSSTRQHGGLGLGLSIVRHLIELHGGSVSVESPGEGQGATFRVILPLGIASRNPADLDRRPPVVTDATSSDPACDLTGINTLVVDDEADARDLIAIILTRCGATVKVVSSAEEAIAKLREWRPHVLISDIGMPIEDGYMLIRKVRAMGIGRGGEIPAVALTAYARAEDRLKALSAGFQMHLAKPVNPAELAVVIGSLTQRIPKA